MAPFAPAMSPKQVTESGAEMVAPEATSDKAPEKGLFNTLQNHFTKYFMTVFTRKLSFLLKMYRVSLVV